MPGLLGVGLILAVIATAAVVLPRFGDAGGLRKLKAQARESLAADPPRNDLAIKYLDRFLERSPRDVEALEMRSKLLADLARDGGQTQAAIDATEYLVRLDPDGEGRRETRRRLTELYLRMEPFVPAANVQYRTAATLAESLIREAKAAGKPEARDHVLLGRALRGLANLGDAQALALAVEQYAEATRLEPAEAGAAAMLAALYQDRVKDPAKAQAALDALLKASPTAEAHMVRHLHYARAGRRAEASEEMEEAVGLAPESLEIRLAAARDALSRDDLAAARAHLAAIPPGRAANSIDFRLVRGLVELRENHADDAITDWRQALLLTSGGNAEATFSLAEVLLQLGRLEDAKPLMDQYGRLTVGENGAKAPASRLLEAIRDVKTGQPARAIATLEEVRANLPPTMKGQGCVLLGRCYEATGEPEKAMGAYREAIKAAPALASPRLRIAALLQAKSPGAAGRAAAAEELEKGLERAPEDVGLLLGVARARLARGDWASMKEALDRAAAIAPRDPDLIALQAEYLAGTGKLDGAAALLAKAAESVDPRNAGFWVAWAGALARQGKPEEALRVLDRAALAENAGDHAAIRVARARFQVAAGHGTAALEELDRNLKELPPSERPPVLRAKADLLFQQGRKAKALEILGQLARALPDDPSPGLQLLDQAVADGDEAAASAAIDALAKVKRSGGAYERLGRAYELIRRSPAGLPAAKVAAGLDEAATLLEQAAEKAPQLPEVHGMRGLLLERRAALAKDADARDAALDGAIAAYKKALSFGSGRAISGRLIDLLARRGRPEELEELRRKVDSPRDFDRRLAAYSLQAGLDDLALETVTRMVKGEPESLDVATLRSNVLSRLGRPEEAEKALKDLAVARGGEPGPWFQLLNFQAGRNEPDAMLATAEEIRGRVKGDRAAFLHARAFAIAGDARRAGELFREARKAWPEDAGVARVAAEFFAGNGQAGEAEAILDAVLKADPASSWASRQLALILSGRPKDAASWARAWALVRPDAPGAGDAPEDRLARAVVLLRSPDPAVSAGAIEALKALKDDLPPGHRVGAEARSLLLRILLSSDQPAEARDLALEATADGEALPPDNLALYCAALIRDGKPEEARKPLARLAEAEPKSLRTEALRARLLQAEGHPEDAEKALEKAFADREASAEGPAAADQVVGALLDLKHPEAAERVARAEVARRPESGWLLAAVLNARGQVDGAMRACLEAVEKGGSRLAVRSAAALATARDASPETLEGADAVVTAALVREPDDLALLLLRAQVRHLQGRFGEEIKAYQDARARKPADLSFLNNMAWTLSESLNRPADALKPVEEAMDHAGRQPQFLDTRGVILTRLNRLDEAIKDLEIAAKAMPAGSSSLHLARALNKAGKAADARKALERGKRDGKAPERLDPKDLKEWEALDASLPKA